MILFQVIYPPELDSGSGAIRAVTGRSNEAGNFDYRRSGFKNPKNLNTWAIVRLGHMRLNDDDLEYFENIMNQTAREYGMNLEICKDQGTKFIIEIERKSICDFPGFHILNYYDDLK